MDHAAAIRHKAGCAAVLTAKNAAFNPASSVWRLVTTSLPINRNLRCRNALRRHQSKHLQSLE